MMFLPICIKSALSNEYQRLFPSIYIINIIKSMSQVPDEIIFGRDLSEKLSLTEKSVRLQMKHY
jgi:hypothetical protein